MLAQVATQTVATQGVQHKCDWELAVKRAKAAKKELAELKAKILVPTKKTSSQLATERNVATMNAYLVVTLTEQLAQVAPENNLLEEQLKEARAFAATSASRAEPGDESGTR